MDAAGLSLNTLLGYTNVRGYTKLRHAGPLLADYAELQQTHCFAAVSSHLPAVK